MRNVVAVLLACAFAPMVCGGDAENDAVEKAIAALNKAFADGNVEAMRRLMAPEHIAITSYYGGPVSRDDQIKTLGDMKVSEYAAGTMKTTMISKGVALITYPLTSRGTYRGKPLPVRNYASALWVYREGSWREVFYQESALTRTEAP